MSSALTNVLGLSKMQVQHLDQETTVHAVLGNEACDLDSVVSCIVYALHLQSKLPPSSANPKQVIVPVLNIPRAEYPLRTEITYTLNRFDVSPKDLVFIDEIDLNELLKNNKLAVTLVDHNILAQRQTDLISVLVEVIDHHKDELPPSPCYTKTIVPVGSCSTLVAEKLQALSPALLDKQVISLLLASILMDTVNLDERAGRMTPKDLHLVRELEKRKELEFTTGELYTAISKAKFDVSSLTSMEILRKDYKAVPVQPSSSWRVGISSIGLPLEDFLTREHIKDTLQEFCSVKGLNTFVVMAMYFDELDGPPLRQLCVCGSAEDGVNKLTQYLVKDDQLQLSTLQINIPGIFCFNQRNVKASRKLVFPLVMNFLKSF